MNGFHLLLLVGLALVAVDVWDRRRRARQAVVDTIEVAGIAINRREVYRVDRRVRPDGNRDVVVFLNGENTGACLTGDDVGVFLSWWQQHEGAGGDA